MIMYREAEVYSGRSHEFKNVDTEILFIICTYDQEMNKSW